MAPRPRKRFAQHWLRSEKALQQIVKAADLSGGESLVRSKPAASVEEPLTIVEQPAIDGSAHVISPVVAIAPAISPSLLPAIPSQGDCVLEIGPGLGVLTRQLLGRSRAVVSVEIDRDLCVQLRKNLGDPPNFLLLQGDFLSLELDPILQQFPAFQAPNKVVANIPYNITGPILEKLLGTIAQPNPHPYDSLVLLMQKEVAERLCARPGRKAFGALSVRVQYLAECEWVCDVPARAFQPPPKVDSAVVRLKPRRSLLSVDRPQRLETLIKVGFANRRKMLRNNLKGLWAGVSGADQAIADSAEADLGQDLAETPDPLANAPIDDRDDCVRLLEHLGLNPQARAEDLGVDAWVALSNAWGKELALRNAPSA
jgi:16S rRNA (adenine1518-N6/adenine1519-N6)-dimethyltransferase